jgi:hypothetical protein
MTIINSLTGHVTGDMTMENNQLTHRAADSPTRLNGTPAVATCCVGGMKRLCVACRQIMPRSEQA